MYNVIKAEEINAWNNRRLSFKHVETGILKGSTGNEINCPSRAIF